MRYLLLSVLVVCVIGVMIPSAFGLFHSSPIGESIIKEKECDIIGKEIDSNIECRLVLKNWDEIVPDVKDDRDGGYGLLGYDSDNDLMYFSMYSSWDYHWVFVEMDNFTIVDEVKCDGVTTGTYTKETTYSCKLSDNSGEIEILDQKGGAHWNIKACSKRSPYDADCTEKWLTQSQTTVPYQYALERSCYIQANNIPIAYCEEPYKLRVYSAEKTISNCYDRNLVVVREGFHPNLFNCIIEDGNEVLVRPIHTYSTDKTDTGKIFLNENRNELYHFIGNVVYQINGMGELKSTAAASEPEPTQSSGGCGEGTELVNGVCQLTKTSGTSQEDSFGVSNLVSVIVIIIAIVGTIALVKSRKKKSSIIQPTPEKTKPKPRRKPAESRPTSSSCSNCGNSLKKTAKFCGKCGTPVS